jgi:hypothetical protein
MVLLISCILLYESEACFRTMSEAVMAEKATDYTMWYSVRDERARTIYIGHFAIK